MRRPRRAVSLKGSFAMVSNKDTPSKRPKKRKKRHKSTFSQAAPVDVLVRESQPLGTVR